MKKVILILVAVAIVSAKGLSQDPPKEKAAKKTPEERAENMTQRLTKELDLNPEQQAKTKAIILRREQEREKVTKDMKDGHEKLKAEFKTFLSSEQFQKFEKKHEEMKQKHEERKKVQRRPKEDASEPPAPEEK